MNEGKKFLPLILLGIGALVVVGVFFMNKSKTSNDTLNEDEMVLAEVPLSKRPLVSLTPTKDGHYLKLKMENIVLSVDSFDYELLYQTGEGVTQGVSGFEQLNGKTSFETDLLLGSESSGKFRYDEGVESGSIEFKFRKDKKLVAKFKTEFKLTKTDSGYEVTMNTIGGDSEDSIATFTSE